MPVDAEEPKAEANTGNKSLEISHDKRDELQSNTREAIPRRVHLNPNHFRSLSSLSA